MDLTIKNVFVDYGYGSGGGSGGGAPAPNFSVPPPNFQKGGPPNFQSQQSNYGQPQQGNWGPNPSRNDDSSGYGGYNQSRSNQGGRGGGSFGNNQRELLASILSLSCCFGQNQITNLSIIFHRHRLQ